MTKNIFYTIYAFIFAVIWCVSSQSTHATTYKVDTYKDIETDCTYTCSLRSALEIAQSNGEVDTIIFDPSITHVLLDSELVIQDDPYVKSRYDVKIKGYVKINVQKNDRVMRITKNASVYLHKVDIVNGYFIDKKAMGAGIYNEGRLFLNEVNIYGNMIRSLNNVSSHIRGAGIYNGIHGNIRLHQSTVGPRNILIAYGYDNVRAEGAGIYNAGNMTMFETNAISNYIFTKSYSDNGMAKGHGAGIYNVSLYPLYVKNSAIVWNMISSYVSGGATHSYARGAGIHNEAYTHVNLDNVTISSNNAIASGELSTNFTFANGGGIWEGAHAKLYAANVTLAHNSVVAQSGTNPGFTGVHSLFGTITNKSDVRFKNSIITSQGKNCNHVVETDGYNSESDNSCGFKSTGDVQNDSIELESLTLYDALTYSHKLSVNSSAFDTANPLGCHGYTNKLLQTDQRKKKRHVGNCDRGAHENQ